MTVWGVKKRKKPRSWFHANAVVWLETHPRLSNEEVKASWGSPGFFKPFHVISVCWYCIYVLCCFSVFKKYTCTCLLQLWVLCRLPSGMENSPSDPLHSHLYAFAHSSLSSLCSPPQLFDTHVCVKQRKKWKYCMPQIVRRAFPLLLQQCVYNSLALRLYLFLKALFVQRHCLILCLTRPCKGRIVRLWQQSMLSIAVAHRKCFSSFAALTV